MSDPAYEIWGSYVVALGFAVTAATVLWNTTKAQREEMKALHKDHTAAVAALHKSHADKIHEIHTQHSRDVKEMQDTLIAAINENTRSLSRVVELVRGTIDER